jgi:uncharacterized protein
MQFLVLGYDSKDDKALERRLANREQHLAYCDQLKARGNLLFGMAILDDAERMIGSAVVLEYPSRADVDAYLAAEPYVTGKVWDDITVQPCKVGPAFEKPSS